MSNINKGERDPAGKGFVKTEIYRSEAIANPGIKDRSLNVISLIKALNIFGKKNKLPNT